MVRKKLVSKVLRKEGVFFTLIMVLSLVTVCPSQAIGPGSTFDYGNYQRFLDKYVVEEHVKEGLTLNVVDYDSIFTSRNSPDSLYRKILSQLTQFDPQTLQTRDEQIAFWINAYNIGAIKIIIDHYPVDSIRSRKINWLKRPWAKKVLRIGNAGYSLHQIKNDILIDTCHEPLVHYALVHASLSCPDLSPKVYRGNGLQGQLKNQAKRFLQNRTKGLRVERDQELVFFSQIFKADKKSFPEGPKGALSIIKPFIENEEDRQYVRSGNYQVQYLPFHWTLNSLQDGN